MERLRLKGLSDIVYKFHALSLRGACNQATKQSTVNRSEPEIASLPPVARNDNN